MMHFHSIFFALLAARLYQFYKQQSSSVSPRNYACINESNVPKLVISGTAATCIDCMCCSSLQRQCCFTCKLLSDECIPHWSHTHVSGQRKKVCVCAVHVWYVHDRSLELRALPADGTHSKIINQPTKASVQARTYHVPSPSKWDSTAS